MKNALIVLLALAAVGLGIAYAVQSHKSAAQQAQISSLQNEADEKSRQIETLQTAQDRSEQQRQELMAQTYQLTAQVHAGQMATNPPKGSASNGSSPQQLGVRGAEQTDLGNVFSKMMQDPDTRQLVRTTQRMMMDQLYSPLIAKMGLSPDEASKFKDLLADNTMSAADKAYSMVGGPGSTNRSDMFATMAADQKNFDEQIKSFLGDARYSQYKDYQETVAERMQLNAFKQQAGSDYNLTDQQSEALLNIMKEEQKNASAKGSASPGGSTGDGAMAGLVSEDKMNALLQTQQTVAQQVYDRARSVLSPDQLGAFGQFQTNQIQMMRMGMSMARKMFGPTPLGGSAVPPN